MTRTDCMIKLLRHGALTFRECVEITGWPHHVVQGTLRYLRNVGRIKHDGNWNGQYYLGFKTE